MPVGDYSKTGLLGGWVDAQEDALANQKTKLDIQRSSMDLRKKALEVGEFEQTSPVRMKQAKVQEQMAERQIAEQPTMDKAFRLKLENEVDQMSSDMDSRQLEDFSRKVSSLDKNTYAPFYDTLSIGEARKWKLTGDWNKDRDTIDYITRRATHNVEQVRKLELERTKAAGKPTTVTKGHTPSAPNLYKQGDLASLRNNMVLNPVFKDMTEFGLFGNEDPTTSPRIAGIVAQVATRANAIMEEGHNKAREASSQGKDFAYLQITREQAMQQALTEQAAYLHDSNPTAKGLQYITPEVAVQREEAWVMSDGLRTAQRSEKFKALHPLKQQEILRNMYKDKQMMDYINRYSHSGDLKLFGE